MRIKIIRYLTIGLFLLIAADLIFVQSIRGRHYYHQSVNNRIRIVPLKGWRGRIKDRRGQILADNRIAYHVMVTPQDIERSHEIFAFLSEVLERDPQKIIQRYHRDKLNPFSPVTIAEDIGRDKAIILEENKYRFPGLIVQKSFKRYYPYGDNTAHVLGYVGKMTRSKIERFKEYGYSPKSIVGKDGVEEYYDAYLRGEDGGLQVEVNNRGQQVRLLSLKEPTKGQDITLTIDGDIQKVITELLGEQRGAIIVMDLENGEILGMASTPSYDPNIFVDPHLSPQRQKYLTNPMSPFLNRATKGLFPPGSVFKVPVALCGLDSQKIIPHTTFSCPGYHEVGGIRFGCTHAHGPQNLIQSLSHSCNVYYYHLGMTLGANLIARYARMLGLGKLTHIDLPYEKTGYVPSRRQGLLYGRRRWYTGDTLNLSIGQGDVLTTPLQLIRMMGIVANEGVEVQPHVIQKVSGVPVEKYDFKRQLKIDLEAFRTVKKGLRAAVVDYSGTAHVLDVKGLTVAGKTGTAQTSRRREHHAWFVGYAQNRNKKIAICVFLEYGGSSQNACLLARQLLVHMQKQGVL